MSDETCPDCGLPKMVPGKWKAEDCRAHLGIRGETTACHARSFYRLQSKLADAERRLAELDEDLTRNINRCKDAWAETERYKVALAQAERVVAAADLIFSYPQFHWRQVVGRILADGYDAERAKMGEKA